MIGDGSGLTSPDSAVHHSIAGQASTAADLGRDPAQGVAQVTGGYLAQVCTLNAARGPVTAP